MPDHIRPSLPLTLLARCRTLRQTATDAESLLWSLLRSRQIAGAKFRRQHLFAGYILDFYCHEANLAIEVDGGGHYEDHKIQYDEKRTKILEGHGIKVIRFTNDQVLIETESVVQAILDSIESQRTPSPCPPPKGEGARRALRGGEGQCWKSHAT